MELFAITCTTCKSRLRVRDQAAVGQILACPKCGGMVMVKPPPAWHEAGEQKSDLPTATEVDGPVVQFNQTLHSSAFDVLEDLLSDAPPKVQPPPANPETGSSQPRNATPTPPAPPKPRFVGGPPVHRSATPSVHRSATPPAAPPVKPGTTPVAGAAVTSAKMVKPPTDATAQAGATPPAIRETKVATPPKPPEIAASATASQPASSSAGRSYWLLMAGSIALGILLAFAAVTAAIHFLNPTSVTKAIPKRSATKATVKEPEVEQPSQAATIAAAASDPDLSPTATPTNAASIPQVDNDPTPTSPISRPQKDPLDLVKSPPTAAAAPVATNSPLDKFREMIGGATNDPLAKTTEQPRTATASLPPPDSAPARPLAPRPQPRDIDVARRLADPLTAIETAGTPLADFVQLLSDLSTIPITLDVPFTPAAPQTHVALNLSNTTVEKALVEALRPLRLEHVVVDDQLVIRRAEPSVPLAFTQIVKDLAGHDEQQLTELADVLKSVVEPGAWNEEQGGGSIAVDAAKGALAITHRRAVQFQVLMAVEKLRSACATAPPADGRPDLYKLDTRSTLAKTRLEKPITLNYSQPTRLVTILERLGDAAGMRIVVDWRDVASAGWNPAGEATLVASNQPLAAALDALLNPLDLTWRIVDSQTLQVVTPARLAEQGELELYKVDGSVAGGTTAEALIGQIRVALGEGTFTSGGGGGEIRYEPDSKCLLAWLPQMKQQELEAILRKLREGAK